MEICTFPTKRFVFYYYQLIFFKLNSVSFYQIYDDCYDNTGVLTTNLEKKIMNFEMPAVADFYFQQYLYLFRNFITCRSFGFLSILL